jgi:hypothetical protein
MSKKLECVVSGKTIVVSDEYYQKKVTDFGSEEKVKSLYVSRQVKNLLKRGYKVAEIRDLLKIDNTVEIPDSIVKQILNLNEDDGINLDKIGIKNSDPEVVELINNIRNSVNI